MSGTSVNRDSVLGASLVLSVVSLVLLLVVTWHFQSSLNLLQQQVEYDRELLLELQDQQKVAGYIHVYYTCDRYTCMSDYLSIII